MSTRNGLNCAVYIDARVLADLLRLLVAQHLAPMNYSELIRMILVDVRDTYVAKENQIATVDEALQMLIAAGLSTNQLGELSHKHRRMLLTQLQQESTSILQQEHVQASSKKQGACAIRRTVPVAASTHNPNDILPERQFEEKEQSDISPEALMKNLLDEAAQEQQTEIARSTAIFMEQNDE